MKLEALKVRNFRCYKAEFCVRFADITALIGKNDSGKSSLMDALDIFLNDGAPDGEDAAKSGNPKDLVIACEFSDLPVELVIDDAFPTTLAAEGLLNGDGHLEIHKRYSGDLKSPKCTSVEAYCLHPTAEGAADLLQLKNADLKARAKDLDVDLDGINQKINAQLRARIREHIGELSPQPVFVPLNDDNAKKIWAELKKYIPALALFKSDRASTDQDAEAQDPLKAAVKEAIKEQEDKLKEVEEFVQSQVKSIADETLKKLQELDANLASQLNPTFQPPKWENLFKASITGDDDIPINKRGSGVKRLVLLSFFRAKAEKAAQKSDHGSVIYAIEEPETSQHPNNQRVLLRALMDLSAEYQVVITTHTPMLARSLPDHCLRYVHVNDDDTRSIKTGGPATNTLLARTLGVLPDSTVQVFIGVEGPNDIAFLQRISEKLSREETAVADLEAAEIAGTLIFFPLGGSTLALWSSRLQNLNRPEFHLYDRDTVPPEAAKYQEHVDTVNGREGCVAWCTGKLEIENYLHIDAIKATYAAIDIELGRDQNFGDFDDVPSEVARLVHEQSGSETPWNELNEKKQGKKVSKAKRLLCSQAPLHMTPDLLNEIDPDGELLGWLKEISKFLCK
jgi:putative ATP-dependent endonuclease of the OLD family